MIEKLKTLEDIVLHINHDLAKVKGDLIREHHRISALTVFYSAYTIALHRGDLDRSSIGRAVPKYESVCGIFLQIAEDNLAANEKDIVHFCYNTVKTPKGVFIPVNLSEPPSGSTLSGINRYARKLYRLCVQERSRLK